MSTGVWWCVPVYDHSCEPKIADRKKVSTSHNFPKLRTISITEYRFASKTTIRHFSTEAMSRKMYAAPKRAIIGENGIDPLEQLYFLGWTKILDFLCICSLPSE